MITEYRIVKNVLGTKLPAVTRQVPITGWSRDKVKVRAKFRTYVKNCGKNVVLPGMYSIITRTTEKA